MIDLLGHLLETCPEYINVHICCSSNTLKLFTVLYIMLRPDNTKIPNQVITFNWFYFHEKFNGKWSNIFGSNIKR